MFELANQGNVDIDLLFAEVWVPRCILHPTWASSSVHYPPVIEMHGDTPGYLHVQHYSIPGREEVRRLEPVMTRSMGVRRIRDLKFWLKGQYTEGEENQIVRYHIHARNYDTSPEETRFKDIQHEN